ncbi:GP179 protein, partial [Grantiella picta]|nr:GP179 protein [Grantiella picta]
RSLDKGSCRDRESICPWESLDTEELSLKIPGKEPSKKSESTESRKSEICPWEVAEPPSQQPKAKQVPPGSSKGDKPLTRQAALASPERSLDKGSCRDRESICPWESLDTQQPLGKPQTGSSALPKAPSGKSLSSEKAEICPWESQDSKSSDKSEICPWEEATPHLEKGTTPGKEKLPPKEVTKALEKG